VSEWLWLTLALAEPALLLAYFALFVARKDVSPRPKTMAGIIFLGLVAQVGILVQSEGPPPSSGVVVVLMRAVVIALFFSQRNTRLVHARPDEVRAELLEACRRLFIDVQEPRPGELLLSARGVGVSVRLLRSLGPTTLILFPPPPGPGKLALLFDWLKKRYPGPIPRIRVTYPRR
jgi:hypothetical protein